MSDEEDEIKLRVRRAVDEMEKAMAAPVSLAQVIQAEATNFYCRVLYLVGMRAHKDKLSWRVRVFLRRRPWMDRYWFISARYEPDENE